MGLNALPPHRDITDALKAQFTQTLTERKNFGFKPFVTRVEPSKFAPKSKLKGYYMEKRGVGAEFRGTDICLPVCAEADLWPSVIKGSCVSGRCSAALWML